MVKIHPRKIRLQIILNEHAEPELFKEFIDKDPMARGARMRYLAQVGLMLQHGKLAYQPKEERLTPAEPAADPPHSATVAMSYDLGNLCSDADLIEMQEE